MLLPGAALGRWSLEETEKRVNGLGSGLPALGWHPPPFPPRGCRPTLCSPELAYPPLPFQLISFIISSPSHHDLVQCDFLKGTQ